MDLKIRLQGKLIETEWENRTAISAIMNKLSALKRLSLTKNGIRQVCSLDISVPRNDRQINTKPGDICVENGKLVFFLGEAAVSCTKLGEIKGMSESSIKNLLTPGTLRLELFEG